MLRRRLSDLDGVCLWIPTARLCVWARVFGAWWRDKHRVCFSMPERNGSSFARHGASQPAFATIRELLQNRRDSRTAEKSLKSRGRRGDRGCRKAFRSLFSTGRRFELFCSFCAGGTVGAKSYVLAPQAGLAYGGDFARRGLSRGRIIVKSDEMSPAGKTEFRSRT